MPTIGLRELAYYQGNTTINGRTYKLTLKWNGNTEKWYMDIKSVTGPVDIKGVALLVGIDLLAPYGYSDIIGPLEIIDNSGANEDPEYEGIGDRWTLEYTEI